MLVDGGRLVKLSPKSLLAAAAVMVVALTPSVADCLSMHEEAPQHSWKLGLWIGVAAIIALLFGEQLMGSRR